MADIGGDGASMMMGSMDSAAFIGGDEDLFLPGDSLFGFSAAAGIGGPPPDVGGSEGNASFPGGSASLLFPPMSSLQASGSFQAMASLPPEPDSAEVVSTADVMSTSSRRKAQAELGGATGGAAGLGVNHREGNSEGGAKSSPTPSPIRAALSLKQSLDAAIASAAARDAENAAAAAVMGERGAGTKTNKSLTKAKSPAGARRHDSGRGGKRTNSSKAGNGFNGFDVDSGKTAVAAGGNSSVVTPRRPARNLRRRRQESNNNGEQVVAAKATIAAADSTAAASSSGDVLRLASRRGAASRTRGKAGQQNTRAAKPSAATAAVDSDGASVSRTKQLDRQQRSGSPCRPPPRKTSRRVRHAERGGSREADSEPPAPGIAHCAGTGPIAAEPATPSPPPVTAVVPPVGAVSLPAGMELIPGFEDTIDSHFMTALLQKVSDTRPGVSASDFSSAESHGWEAHGDDGYGSVGGQLGFGRDPHVSLGFSAALLPGRDSQPSARHTAAAVAAATKEASGYLSGFAAAANDGACLGTDGGGLDAAGPSMAQHVAGDAASLSSRPGEEMAPPMVLTGSSLATATARLFSSAVATDSTPSGPLPHPPALSSPATLSPALPASFEAPASAGPRAPSAAFAASPKSASSVFKNTSERADLATPTDSCVTKCNANRDQPKDSAKSTMSKSAEERKAARKMKQSQQGASTSPTAARPSASVLGGASQLQSGAAVLEVGAAPTPPAEPSLAKPSKGDKGAATRLSKTSKATQAKRAPHVPSSPLPPPGSAASLGKTACATESSGVDAGGFRLPAAAVKSTQEAEAACRQLPRKVSLRFSPRDKSTEVKLSEHGYIPFQKLTAPLWKPLEAVFKFMMKKWSEVTHEDLNSIRIVFDVDDGAGDSAAAAIPAFSPSPAHRTMVWSAEHGKSSLVDLVKSLPDYALERIRDEQALDLSYTFATGPVGPPPSWGSAPWDAPHETAAPALATAPAPTAAPPLTTALTPVAATRPPQPPPPTHQRPIASQLGTPYSSSGAFSLPRQGVAATPGSAAATVVARGMAVGNGNQSAVNVGVSGAGGWPNGPRLRAMRAGGALDDAIANSALRRHYKNINRMFLRQGIASPPVTHFLPGGLFARMHTAAIAGVIGSAALGGGVIAGAGKPVTAALPGFAGVPAERPAKPVLPASGEEPRDEKGKEQGQEALPEDAGGPQDMDDGGGGFEDFGGDANSEAGDGARGEEASGALMGDETCMALFSDKEVELLMDPSPPPTVRGEAVTGVEGKDNNTDVGAATPAARQVSPPLTGGTVVSASAAKPAASGGGDAQACSASPLAHSLVPSPINSAVVTTAEPTVAPTSPPPADSVRMGEETCMALFGGSGVELLVDPFGTSAGAGEEAAALGGGEHKQIDLGAAPKASQNPGGEAGDEKESGWSPIQPVVQPEWPPNSGATVAAGGEASTQPALRSRTAGVGDGVGVAAIEAAGVEASTHKTKTTAVPPARANGVTAACVKGALTPGLDMERLTAQRDERAAAAVETKEEGSEPNHTPPRTAEAPSVPPGPSTAFHIPRADGETDPQLVEENGAASLSSSVAKIGTKTSSILRSVAAEPTVALAAEGPDKGAAAVSVAGAPLTTPQAGAKVASPAGDVSTSEASPRGKRGRGEEGATKPAAVVLPPAEEPPPRSAVSVPNVHVQPAPQFPRSPLLVFKMGTLPTRAKLGRTPSSAFAAAALTLRSEVATSANISNSSSTGPSMTPAQVSPRPSSAMRKVAPSLSHGDALETGESRLANGSHQQRELERVTVVAAPKKSDVGPKTQARGGEEEVIPIEGVAPEALAADSNSGGGGGGAVSVTAPPAPPPVQQTACAADVATLSHAGGRRKPTRSCSNGGDPVSFGSSGGGRSSRSQEEGERDSKKSRRDAPCFGAGVPSVGVALSRPSRLAESTETKLRRSGSGKDARQRAERKRVAPMIVPSGGMPQRAATPVFGAAAEDAPQVLRGANAPPVSVSGPFGFASAKQACQRPPSPSPSLPSVGTDRSAPTANGGRRGTSDNTPAAIEESVDNAPAPADKPICERERVALAYHRGATAARDGDGALVTASAINAEWPIAGTATASSIPMKPRRFAFAAQNSDRGELLRHGEQSALSETAEADASVEKEMLPRGITAAWTPVADSRSPHSNSPPSKATEAPGPTERRLSLPSPPPVAVAARKGVSASPSPSMSPEEVQAEYSEAWSSLPSCFWDESALLDGDGGGEQLDGDGPVTRWLALPRSEPTLGGVVAGAAPLSAAAPAYTTVASSGLDGCRVGGGKEAEAGALVSPRFAAPPSKLAEREEKRSSWASFCAAFASSRGSPGATTPSSPSARSIEEARSLPTLIRIGRSMTKGVSLVNKNDAREAVGASGVAAGAATGKGPQSASGVTAADNAPASAPPNAASAAGTLLHAGLRAGGGGGGKDTPSADAISGSRRKRDSVGADEGGEGAAASTPIVATALPKKRSKKKGRIAPTLVSSLPPGSFGTATTGFSSDRRA